MPGRLRSLTIVTLIFLAGGLILPSVAMTASISSPGTRIWYPAGHYPQLDLPGGRHEVVRSLLNIIRPMHFGDFIWDEDHIPQGPLWVRVDLSRQLLSVFRGGHEIGSAVILYGGGGNPTPTGRFPILQKDADYYSHSYHVPMPYMLRLTKDGVAIHGSSVREGWATHGCIGVPPDFARLLFAATSKGDPVFILPAQ
jgi:L,D-transpeptidase catalytic domain